MNTRHSSYSLLTPSKHLASPLTHSFTQWAYILQQKIIKHQHCHQQPSLLLFIRSQIVLFFTQLHLHSPFTHIPFSSAHSFNSFFLFTFNCCYPPCFSLFSSLLSFHIKKRSIGLNYKVSFSVLFSAIELRLTG